jgi:hypothetical protein
MKWKYNNKPKKKNCVAVSCLSLLTVNEQEVYHREKEWVFLHNAIQRHTSCQVFGLTVRDTIYGLAMITHPG